MNVEFLYWSGCPSHAKALGKLREAMADLAIDPASLVVREIRTEEGAVVAGFPGSPTIRVDGADIAPTDEAPQLSCRIYRRRDGRVSPTPDLADVHEALSAATNNSRRK